MNTKSIGFIGGGRITKIFLKAFSNSTIPFDKIIISEPNLDVLAKLTVQFPGIAAAEDLGAFAGCDVVFLATHPPIVMDVLAKLLPHLDGQSILVSLAPKITIDKMKTALPGFTNIARVNPSAPGIINQGMNPVALAEGMSEDKRNELLELLGILGKTFVVPEQKIEAYAVISAMGSTYFWFQLKQLQDLALLYGMDEGEAKEVITEMLRGTANTLFSSGLPDEEVMDLVPVRPLSDYEDVIKSYYREKLNGIYAKIKP